MAFGEIRTTFLQGKYMILKLIARVGAKFYKMGKTIGCPISE
jgi:hypothetical protein